MKIVGDGDCRMPEEWIVATGDHRGFVAKLGKDRVAELQLRKEPW